MVDLTHGKIPQWQSHKRVWASKIMQVLARPVTEPLCKDDTFFDWLLECGESVHVSHEMRRRAADNPVGGYYVLYADGFESWSPAKAFEEGYTLLEA